jgi:TPR repeat protein
MAQQLLVRHTICGCQDRCSWRRPERTVQYGRVRCQTNENIEEAVSWFMMAAEQGYALAQLELAICYINGEGVPENRSLGLEWLRKATEHGVVEAQRELGGALITKDLTELKKWRGSRKQPSKGT